MAKIKAREPRTDLEDLRDDTIAVVLNSRMTFRQVQEKGGPTQQTISKWLYRETKFPRLDTIRATLQACDYDFVVVPINREPEVTGGPAVEIRRQRPKTELALPPRKRRNFRRGR